ncbi:hypothetical protein VOLCADRAFT_89355 [Volvox carteri f. nagariensis]|uniref:DUF4350 domain-containing protein n=1 Tax=Volvox carteri f. nagariensis TaxID=3068 RepID=D8TRH6_VOLCA|nr:uncharacterized protein VOLCADRAFT_89355 [Volvox carteri f. nagariensis]EFJ49995.1 hypothetical protein VOLCADRAFT_89355 [Volvox carteri f. nagariensis]|eukprot:XP_002949060.1 hypothetical protein VOLCADRAFT_89355 [Volvox carteri f. nagariensis]
MHHHFPRLLAGLLLGLGAHAGTPFTVFLYANMDVVAGPVRLAVLSDSIQHIAPGSRPISTTTQPTARQLANAAGFVIPANKGSYILMEDLASNPQKVSSLIDFVKGGGALVLLDGYDAFTNTNTFMPLLGAMLDGIGIGSSSTSSINVNGSGSGSHDSRLSSCRAVGIKSMVLVQLRFTGGYFTDLAPKLLVKPDQGVSGISCAFGKAIYSAFTANRTQLAVAWYWGLGRGAIYWIGSGFQVPHLKGYEEVLAAAFLAAAAVKASPEVRWQPSLPNGITRTTTASSANIAAVGCVKAAATATEAASGNRKPGTATKRQAATGYGNRREAAAAYGKLVNTTERGAAIGGTKPFAAS